MESKTNAPVLQENKMGVMPVGKLLFNMALPMIISMIVQARTSAACFSSKG